MCRISKGYLVTRKDENGQEIEKLNFFHTNEAAKYFKVSPQYMRKLADGKVGKKLLKKKLRSKNE